MGEKEKGSDKLETNGKKKVIVGMSGGVDSSVAAILLMEKGYEVEGLFMRNWDSSINNDILGNPNLDHLICPQEEDYNDAKKVCEKLNIPLHRIDFIQEYWDDVFEYFDLFYLFGFDYNDFLMLASILVLYLDLLPLVFQLLC